MRCKRWVVLPFLDSGLGILVGGKARCAQNNHPNGQKSFSRHETGGEQRLTVMPISKKLALSGPPINKRKLTAGNGPYAVRIRSAR
jgi:hypothetical protein